MITANRFFISILLALAISAICGVKGAMVVNYLVAAPTSIELLIWFNQHGSLQLAQFLVEFTMHLLGLGILAVLLGLALGKTKHCLSNRLISHLSVISSTTILGGGEPVKNIRLGSLTFAILARLFLPVGADCSRKKYNHKLTSLFSSKDTLSNKG